MFGRKKKLGLALGGGAAKGLAHIGILKVLDEYGIKPDFISGTSIGALIGALYASGKTGIEIENIALELNRKDIKKALKITLSGAGFISGEKISELLYPIIEVKNIDELKIPFACTACNIINGEEFIFTEGYISEAIGASISIPGIFSPVKHNKAALVDGGLVNPVPVDLVREMGADYVIAVNVLTLPKIKHKKISFPEHRDEKKIVETNISINKRIKRFVENELNEIETIARKLTTIFDIRNEINIFDVIYQSINLAERNIAEYKLESDKPEMLIEPDLIDIGHFEFNKTAQAAVLGENEMRKYIHKLKRFRK